jgi:hypothetical protein
MSNEPTKTYKELLKEIGQIKTSYNKSYEKSKKALCQIIEKLAEGLTEGLTNLEEELTILVDTGEDYRNRNIGTIKKENGKILLVDDYEDTYTLYDVADINDLADIAGDLSNHISKQGKC